MVFRHRNALFNTSLLQKLSEVHDYFIHGDKLLLWAKSFPLDNSYFVTWNALLQEWDCGQRPRLLCTHTRDKMVSLRCT